MSQYELPVNRLRRMKVNEDFMRSLGIDMSASISERTTVENRRRRRTRAGVDGKGTATVGRTIRTQSAEPRDIENACLLGKDVRSIQGNGEDGNMGGVRKGGGRGRVKGMSEQWWGSLVRSSLTLMGGVAGGRWAGQRTSEALRRGRGQGDLLQVSESGERLGRREGRGAGEGWTGEE